MYISSFLCFLICNVRVCPQAVSCRACAAVARCRRSARGSTWAARSRRWPRWSSASCGTRCTRCPRASTTTTSTTPTAYSSRLHYSWLLYSPLHYTINIHRVQLNIVCMTLKLVNSIHWLFVLFDLCLWYWSNVSILSHFFTLYRLLHINL